jgi:Rieske Fe-S protein
MRGSVGIDAGGYSDPVCEQNTVMIVHTQQGGYAAFPDICMHECCELHFNGADPSCACHTDTFDLDGDVVDGYPTTPLPVLPTCWDSNAVYVTL